VRTSTFDSDGGLSPICVEGLNSNSATKKYLLSPIFLGKYDLKHSFMVSFKANQIMDQTLEDSEEIQALSELLQDPIGLVDISLTGERTEFLKRLTTNSNSVIGELPEDQRAASIIFTPSLLTSFDWGRDELAISFFLDYQRDPGSDALAGLLRLASLSCQGSEVVYQSEAANLLGITLVCKSISLGQIEE